MSIETLIYDLSKDPFNADLNFEVAEEYLRLNQTASAVSFYLRCVEYSGKHNPQAYASLLRMAGCFNDQQGRELSVSNCLLQALAYDDTRPEAYYLMSQFHERAGNWQEAYTFAFMGRGWSHYIEKLPIELGYYGEYCLEFQMAISAWWIGRKEESIATLEQLSKRDMHPIFTEAVNSNLERLSALL